MLMKIKCPKCDTEGTFSLADRVYEGPYLCWKCRAPFLIRIEDDQLKSCQPISQDELQRLQEIKAIQDKMKRD